MQVVVKEEAKTFAGFLTQLCCTRAAPKSEKHGETAQKQVTIMV